MGFFRQEYWSRVPFTPPGDLPDLGVKPLSLMSPALAGILFTTSSTWEALSLDEFTIIIKCPCLSLRVLLVLNVNITTAAFCAYCFCLCDISLSILLLSTYLCSYI